MLRSGVVGTLTMETTIELGYAAKTTADIIKAAAAAYAAACAMFILANEIFPGPAVPPPPFSMCKINHICRFSGVGAGPMQPTDDPNKFTFELVCKYDCGPPFGEKTIPMPADGKCPAVMRF